MTHRVQIANQCGPSSWLARGTESVNFYVAFKFVLVSRVPHCKIVPYTVRNVTFTKGATSLRTAGGGILRKIKRLQHLWTNYTPLPSPV